jgi:hypothetical protein
MEGGVPFRSNGTSCPWSEAALVGPPEPQYKGNPYFAGNAEESKGLIRQAIWTAAQIATAVITMVPEDGKPNSSSLLFALQLQPLYPKRQYGVRKGQVLTLDGCGWEGVLAGVGPTVAVTPGAVIKNRDIGVVSAEAEELLLP